MKLKKYLDVKKHRTNGAVWDNPLKLSEAYLISQMAQDVEFDKIIVRLAEATPEQYEAIFG